MELEWETSSQGFSSLYCGGMLLAYITNNVSEAVLGINNKQVIRHEFQSDTTLEEAKLVVEAMIRLEG
jgi:hypothetical protein